MSTPAVPFSYVQRPLANGVPQSVPFPYLAREHVKLFRNYDLLSGVAEQLLLEGTHYTWINDFSISVVSGIAGTLTILRETPVNDRLVDWADGSNLTAFPMDTADLQVFYAFQELWDRGVITGIGAVEAKTLAEQAAASYLPVTSIAGLPTSPLAGLRVSVYNSTGIETLAAAGMPSGFQGGTALRVRMRWAGTAWDWEGYEALDPDGRYLKRSEASGLGGSSVTRVANKAALPESPAVGSVFVVLDSTGLEAAPAPAGTPPGFVGEPGVRVQLTRGSPGWTFDEYEANDPDGRYRILSRDVVFTAPLAAAGATVDFTVALGKACQLTKVALSQPCWLRLFRSSSQRALDVRLAPGGLLQTMLDLGDAKPYGEFVTTATPQTIVCNPPAALLGDASGLVYARLVNQSGAPAAIAGTLTTLRFEA